MAYNWFKFKQFTVVQERSAMKVGTDGVVLGVTVPNGKYTRILDIGTGTGLVALMMAQRFQDAEIDAIEIDADAAREAEFNFNNSPWASRLRVTKGDVRELNSEYKYSLIVCNPPFFSNSLKNPCQKRTMARHDDNLPLSSLFNSIASLISNDGKAVIIVPASSLDEVVAQSSEKKLEIEKIIDIIPNENKPTVRVVVVLSLNVGGSIVRDSLVLETSVRNQYTSQFFALTRDFYLDK